MEHHNRQYHQMDDPEMAKNSRRARTICQEYNQLPPGDEAAKAALLKKFLGGFGEGSVIQQPFQCDLGSQITIGKNVFINYNCVMLDIAPVTIGDNTLIGPNVGIYGASHPVSPKSRLLGNCWAAPITIGENVWIGGSAVILPGVTIGDNAVIGAGAVVTRDVPPNTVAVGNPARVVGETGD
ncbi:MAG: sugar O-acetyltransferase [Oscillospiraceae bacterium]|nr:sugar O-acetyltransferase [Oscillospiraceae bacterium]